MKNLKRIAELQLQIERLKAEEFGVTNLNTDAVLTEGTVKKFLQYSTGAEFKLLGGNTKGFDIQNEVSGETYEVKSTNTASTGYHYGGLVDKTADYCIFVKWQYGAVLQAEYCLLFPTDVVQANLHGNNNRLLSSRLNEIRGLAQDLTVEFQAFIDLD